MHSNMVILTYHMDALPEYVVLKSNMNTKYLEYVEEEGEVHGRLRFTGKDVHSPLSKFQVEMARSDSKLVHLRCCYNNKYVGAVYDYRYYWIVAEAETPEEDQSKLSCTLFQPVPLADGFRFKHVNTGNYAMPMKGRVGHPLDCCAVALSPIPDIDELFVWTVIDWKSLVVLPQYVAFKGDNGNYLSAQVVEGYSYLKFATSDSGDATVAHEVFPNPDGSIRLKSTHFGKFWRRSPNWIWADSDDTSTDNKDTLFWPVKINDTTIALRNLGNDRFCQSLTTEGKTDCLNAASKTIDKGAQLQVTDLLLSRDIYNVEFQLTRARRYNEQAKVMGSGIASNTTDKENSMDVKVVHTETKTSSWNSSVSLKSGVKTTSSTQIPLVTEGKVEISAEVTTGYQWGKVDTETNTIETVYKALVPPMTRATVSAVGRTATCDIPFSYTQTVTLMDGTQRTYKMSDGTYTCVNSFDVTYEVVHTKIRSPLNPHEVSFLQALA